MRARRSLCRCSEVLSDFADAENADRIDELADVAQLVEQLIRNQQVNGSSPFVGSIQFNNIQRLPEPNSHPCDADYDVGSVVRYGFWLFSCGVDIDSQDSLFK